MLFLCDVEGTDTDLLLHQSDFQISRCQQSESDLFREQGGKETITCS